MNIKSYINKIKDKVKHYDKNAQNPFFKSQFEYNPFQDAFCQTYIWIEPDENSENGEGGSKKAGKIPKRPS